MIHNWKFGQNSEFRTNDRNNGNLVDELRRDYLFDKKLYFVVYIYNTIKSPMSILIFVLHETIFGKIIYKWSQMILLIRFTISFSFGCNYTTKH